MPFLLLQESLRDHPRCTFIDHVRALSTRAALLIMKWSDASFHGLTQFSTYQGHWSCAFRDFERDILPMVESEGMGLAPWGALGRGLLKTPEEYEDASREGRKMFAKQPDSYVETAKVLDRIAKAKHTLITSVALAYVMHKAPYVFPIVGGRKVVHLKGNIEVLGLKLSPEEMDEIVGAVPFDVGFPTSFIIGKDHKVGMTANDIHLVNTNWRLETVAHPQPIPPRSGPKKFETKQ